MASPPWEPYPETKRKFEERGRVKRNTHKQNPSRKGGATGTGNLATDSSFSSISSNSTSSEVLSNDSDDTQGSRQKRRNDSHHPQQHVHARVRPDGCWCQRDGGCGDEDGCCMEDVPHAIQCPCLLRNTVEVYEVSIFECSIFVELSTG